MEINFKKSSTEKQKLIRWMENGFPPINLNEQVSEIKSLISEIITLRYRNEVIKRELDKKEFN